jgi:hypothetical protein
MDARDVVIQVRVRCMVCSRAVLWISLLQFHPCARGELGAGI